MRTVVTRSGLIAAIILAILVAGGIALDAAPAHAAAPDSVIHRLPGVGTFAKSPSFSAQVPRQVIVQYAPSVKVGAMRQAAAAAAADVTMKAAQAAPAAGGVSFAVYESKELSVAELTTLFKGRPGVLRVTPNHVRHAIATTPNDPLFPQQWGLNNTFADADIDAPDAWDLATGTGTDMVIVCIDTGVDYLHADLAPNMWVNPGEIAGDSIDNDGNGYVDDVYGIDAYAGDGDPMDANGHGTHVAGIMAAAGNNDIGVTGVAWGVKIMALRFLGADAAGTDAGAIECINYAIDMKLNRGVNIVAINASWGGYSYNPALEDAVDAAGAAGIVFCAGAGNDALNSDVSPFYPSAFGSSNVISVGATDSWDQKAYFSNYGAANVDLFAPGAGILSTYPETLSYYVPGPGDPYFDDMEGALRWTRTGTWAITTEAYNSPTHAWSDSPYTTYAANTDSNITSNSVDLSSLAGSTAILGWTCSFSLEQDYDYVQILVSGDGGSNWTSIGYLTGTDSGNVYNAALPSDVLTSRFKVRFRLVTDEVYNYDGIYIDDVGVSKPLPSSTNTGYQRVSGTSMATPFVTGTVALLASVAPDGTVAQRIAHILTTADPVSGLAGRCVTGGRLNAAAAVGGAAPVLNSYEQTDGHIAYSPSPWGAFNTPSASGDSYGRSNVAGSSATIHFYGTRLDWIAMKGTTTGSADVYLDDVFQQTVNLAASPAVYKVKVWSATGLPLGPHKVRISYNANNAAGKYITLDRVDVLGSLTYAAPAITGLSPAIGSTGGGTSVTITGTGFSGVTGVTFGGTAATSWTVNGPTQITATAPARVAGTVQVRVTTAAGTSADTSADDFTYIAAPVLTRVDSAVTSAFTTGGTWSTFTTSSAWAGSYRRSSTSGASFSVSFNGTRLDWIATKGTTLGKADVYVDGAFKGTIDLYRSSVAYQQNVFTTGLLSAGVHTFTVVRNSTSPTGKHISLDAVDISGIISTPIRYEQTDSRLLHSGAWTLFSTTKASGGSYARSSQGGAFAVINFAGTRLDWVATRGTTMGKADVYVDGAFKGTIDLYRSSVAYKRIVFSTGNLTPGSHVVRIVRNGTSPTGKYINIDAVDVWGTLN